jgi:mono/diheme cytochrome c family protein
MTMTVTNVTRLCISASFGFMLLGLSQAEAAGDSAKGKAIYEKHCVVCHGPQGKGDGPAGKMLKPPAADLTGAESKKKSEAEVRQLVEKGKPGTAMGPWKPPLTDTEITDVLAYLGTLKK